MKPVLIIAVALLILAIAWVGWVIKKSDYL